MEPIRASTFIEKNRSNKSWDIILPLLVLGSLGLLNHHNLKIKSEPTEWLAKSKALINEGKNEEALEFSLKLLEYFPKNHIYLNQTAMLYAKVGNPAKQAETLEKFIQVAPDPSEVCLTLIDAYRESNQPDKAFQTTEKCLAMDTSNSDFIFQYALAVEKKGDYAKAQELYSDGAKLFPNYTDFAIGSARMHLRNGDANRALVESKKILETHPQAADAQMVAGLAAIRLDKWEEAEKIITEAIQDHPKYQEILELYEKVKKHKAEK